MKQFNIDDHQAITNYLSKMLSRAARARFNIIFKTSLALTNKVYAYVGVHDKLTNNNHLLFTSVLDNNGVIKCRGISARNVTRKINKIINDPNVLYVGINKLTFGNLTVPNIPHSSRRDE